MSVNITVDTTRLDSRINAIKGGMEKAIRRASTRAKTHAKKKISDVIRERVAIKAGTIKSQVIAKEVGKTGQQVTLSKSKRVSLREFGARQTAKGVSYRIAKTGRRGFAAGAFQGPRPGLMFTKYKGTVFKRKGKSRLPIMKIWGPSPWGAFTGGNKERTVEDATVGVGASISELFNKRLQHEINYIISQAK